MYICKLLLTICFVCEVSTKLTTMESKAIQQLRHLVERELYLPYMKTDSFLMRYLEDRSFNVNEAAVKILKMIQWRKDQKIDGILEETNPFLRENIKYQVSTQDIIGNPIITVDFESWGVRRVVLAGKLEVLHRHLVKMFETGVNNSAEIQQKTPDANQWLLLANIQGFSLRKQGCLACIPMYLQFTINYENYYTGSIRYCIVVNAPRSFETISELTRNLMAPGTKKAYKVYNTNKLEWDFLDTIIARDRLPVRYGGIRKKP